MVVKQIIKLKDLSFERIDLVLKKKHINYRKLIPNPVFINFGQFYSHVSKIRKPIFVIDWINMRLNIVNNIEFNCQIRPRVDITLLKPILKLFKYFIFVASLLAL